MTSNIGAKDIARNVSFGFGTSDETGTSYEEMKDRIMGELKKVFRPEFLNRIDEVIVFHKLTMDEIKEIIELMIGRVRAQVAEHELQLDLDEGAKDLLADRGWDPAMGARPLRRAIQRYIEDPLADEVLRQGDIESGSTVLVERDPSGDEEERPLKMTLLKPRKQPAKKREPVGVAAKSSDEEGASSNPGGSPEPEGEGEDGSGPAPEQPPEADAEPE
jgi:ATP-dependent Clp protease ATP-binding subunit ClpC